MSVRINRDQGGAMNALPLPSQETTVPDLVALYRDSGIAEVFTKLDAELVGLAPVKSRIREIAALLLVDNARRSLGLTAGAPSLHMSFTGNPGTGKTTVAMRMAEILHRLGYIRRNQVIAVTRDDLVGQYIGHTAPKTRDVLKRAMGGVLFIDEAYYLYRPENERDYGQEVIATIWSSSSPATSRAWILFFAAIPAWRRALPIIWIFPITVSRSCCRSPNCSPPASTITSTRPASRRCATTSRCASPSHTLPMHARCVTRSTARACARPDACSRVPVAAPRRIATA
jgi:hypothetical protein